MAIIEERLQTTQAVYQLEGTLLEACSCGVLCPCWIGEDPDGGECYALTAYHFTKGHIGGIDVSGLAVVNVVHIPGNVLTPGSWRVVRFVPSDATEEQRQAILGAYRGDYGGPLADLAGLVGEVLAEKSARIEHEVVGGQGTLRIEGVLESKMSPYRSFDGNVTTLRDSVFSTVPGSPAWVSKASVHRVTLPEHGMVWSYEGRNAIQADYKMEHYR